MAAIFCNLRIWSVSTKSFQEIRFSLLIPFSTYNRIDTTKSHSFFMCWCQNRIHSKTKVCFDELNPVFQFQYLQSISFLGISLKFLSIKSYQNLIMRYRFSCSWRMIHYFCIITQIVPHSFILDNWDHRIYFSFTGTFTSEENRIYGTMKSIRNCGCRHLAIKNTTMWWEKFHFSITGATQFLTHKPTADM